MEHHRNLKQALKPSPIVIKKEKREEDTISGGTQTNMMHFKELEDAKVTNPLANFQFRSIFSANANLIDPTELYLRKMFNCYKKAIFVTYELMRWGKEDLCCWVGR